MDKIKWVSLEQAVMLAVARLKGEFRPKDVTDQLDPEPVRQSVLAVLNRHPGVERVRWGYYKSTPTRKGGRR